MKYSQLELLFHPIYSDQGLLNIPPLKIVGFTCGFEPDLL